jgi:hypothetical protein
MGIRFLCPNGHKLHVKAYLAGKKAICPKCQTKVVVPEPGPDELDSADEFEAQNTSAAATFSVPPPASMVEQPPTAVLPLEPSGASDPLAEMVGPVWYVRPATGGQYGPASSDVMRAWIEENRIAGTSLVWREGWPDWRSAAAVFPQLAAPPVTSFAVAAPRPTSTSTLADEQPHQVGASVMPTGQAVTPAVAAVAAPSAAPATLTQTRVQRRRRQNELNMMASIVLGAVTVVLVIVLVVIANQQSKRADNKSSEKTSPQASTDVKAGSEN